jgi:hypothetical protein
MAYTIGVETRDANTGDETMNATMIATWTHTVVATEWQDDGRPGTWGIEDTEGNLVDDGYDIPGAVEEASRLDREQAVREAREAIQEAIDEADGSDDLATLWTLLKALAALRGE